MEDDMLFETERLTVRRIGPEDAGFMLALLNDPGFIANIGDRGVRTIEEAAAYIETRILGSYAANGFGMWRVALKAGDEAIGMVGFVAREGLDAPDLGFAYLAAHTGQGHGLEAGTAALAFGRDALGLDRVLAITAIDNAASAGLLRRLGFREEGRVALSGVTGESRLFVVD